MHDLWPSRWSTADHRLELAGIDLRYAVIVVLDTRRRPTAVPDLVLAIESMGLAVAGASAPNKVLADALRWELRRGRLRRTSRGVYDLGSVARSTRYRARARVRWLARMAAEGAAAR